MRKGIVVLVCLVLLFSGCARRETGSSTTKSITTIKEYGKSLDWCHTNNLIAFEKMGEDSYYDVHIMNPDGSDERCLTHTGGPQKHNGNPAWHPSGEFIVFTAQNEDADCDECDRIAIPGRGINCNLWVVTKDGSQFWQLTTYATSSNPKGVIHPQFSHDGTKLLWAERLSKKKGTPWGEWALKVADFVIDDYGCSLKNIQTYQPGDAVRFYESHAFSSDDTKILFSGNLVLNQLESGLDIYELDLETQKLVRLTDTFEDWDEHAHYSPDGQKIAWMSSTNLGDLGITFEDLQMNTWGLKLKTELWIMDKDGSGKQQLTHFNEPEHPDYVGDQVIVSDSSWGPGGTRIVATLAYKDLRGYHSKIVLIELDFKVMKASLEISPSLDVGFLILDISNDHKLTVAVWYPTIDAPQPYNYQDPQETVGMVAFEGEPDQKNGPYPLIVYSHGYGGSGLNCIYLAEHLAGYGFVVAAPDHEDEFSAMRIRGEGEGDLNEYFKSALELARSGKAFDRDAYSYRIKDVSLVIDEILRLNRDGLLERIVDEKAIGAAGHSLGGYTVLMAGGIDRESDSMIKALLLLSAGVFMFEDEEYQSLEVPVMFMYGEKEGSELRTRYVNDKAQDTARAYKNCRPPKFLLVIRGANHFSFGESVFMDEWPGVGVEEGQKQSAVICKYGLSFFELYLKGNLEAEEILESGDEMLVLYKKQMRTFHIF